jgi:hypothetical protein
MPFVGNFDMNIGFGGKIAKSEADVGYIVRCMRADEACQELLVGRVAARVKPSPTRQILNVDRKQSPWMER